MGGVPSCSLADTTGRKLYFFASACIVTDRDYLPVKLLDAQVWRSLHPSPASGRRGIPAQAKLKA
jgi:hypothetical protein